jgi:hypothetical protein
MHRGTVLLLARQVQLTELLHFIVPRSDLHEEFAAESLYYLQITIGRDALIAVEADV